jgi:hypothetical protein
LQLTPSSPHAAAQLSAERNAARRRVGAGFMKLYMEGAAWANLFRVDAAAKDMLFVRHATNVTSLI